MARRAFPLLLLGILALGAFLRFDDLGGPSLWLDEILHLKIATEVSTKPWTQFVTGFREVASGPENGTLYYALQALGHSIRPGEVGVRLFPAILGLLALPLMALTGRALAGPAVGLLAALLLAISPLHVYFSREGRPYTLLMLLALALLYALLRRGSRLGVVIAYVGCLAAVYTGIHSIPTLISFGALSGILWLWDLKTSRAKGEPWALAALRRSPFIHYVAAGALSLGLAYALYMTRSTINHVVVEKNRTQIELQESPVFLSPLSKRGFEMFAASMTTSGHPSILTNHRSWVLLGFGTLALGFGLGLGSGSVRPRPREPAKEPPNAAGPSPLFEVPTRADLWLTAGMFALPAALSFFALVAVARWYSISYTTPSLPPFLLLTALGLVGLSLFAGSLVHRVIKAAPETPITVVTLVALLAALVAPNLSAARNDPQRKPNWRGVANFVRTTATEGEPIIIPNMWPQICLEYYLERQGTTANFVNAWESPERGQAAVDEYPTGWMITAGFRKRNDVRSWMQGFVPIMKMREQELEVFFFPNFRTLLETRFAAGKGKVFRDEFTRLEGHFDFGGGEMLLKGQGWSFPERNETGTFQWAFGEQTELALPMEPPAGASLNFRALPFLYPEAEPQVVELVLNEHSLGEIELASEWHDYSVPVPQNAWSNGANVLTLKFSRTDRPKDVVPGSGDRRRLSAAFDWLELSLDS